jgi:hypothetical protein
MNNVKNIYKLPILISFGKLNSVCSIGINKNSSLVSSHEYCETENNVQYRNKLKVINAQFYDYLQTETLVIMKKQIVLN